MAIVGTAYVRLRVIGDKLKGDISDATKKAVNQAAPDLKNSGEDAGEHVGEGVGHGVEAAAGREMRQIGDRIGEDLGRAMGNSLGRSLRTRIGSAVRNGINSGRTELNRAENFFKPVSDKFEKFFGDKSKHWQGILGKALTSGISLLALALPSALAFAGAGIGALAATAVTAISAIGPAAAGAAIAGVAAFSAIKISAGLIGLAMKQQTPQLLDFQGRLDKFKTQIATPIQAGLLSGLNASMRLLSPVVTALQPQLKDLGNTVGDLAIGFADAMRQGANLSRLQTILDNNNRFIQAAGGGVSQLGQAFVVLLSHLGPVLDYIGQLVSDIGQWALTAITAAEASGELDSFISRMFDSLTYFVGILVDFGVGIWNVFKAAHGASDGMLTNLHDVAANFRAWTSDQANQDRMTTFFEKMRDIAGQIIGVFGQLAGASARGLESTNVEKFTTALNTLVSVGKAIGGIFEQVRAAAGDKLQTLFQNLSDLLVSMANSGVIGVVADALSNLFAIISSILNIPGVGQLLAFGAGLLVIFKTVSLLWTVLGPIISILWTLIEVVGGALVAAFGWIPVVIGAVIAALVWFFTQTEIGRHIIEVVWNAIKTAIGAAVDWIVGAWNWLVDVFQSVWKWISDIATSIWQAVSTAFNAVVDAVVTAFTTVRDFIVGVWNAIWGFLEPILMTIWNVISTVFNGILTVIQFILDVLYQIWIRIWPILAIPVVILAGVLKAIFEGIWFVVSFIFTTIWDFLVMVWNAISTAISTAVNFIWGIITTVWGAIWGFLQPIIQAIWDFIVLAWTTISNAISAALEWIWGIITTVWNAVWGFISGIINGIVNFISGAWNGLVNIISGAMNAVWGVITTVWNNITGFISGVLDTIGGLIGSVWDTLGDIGSGILDGLKSAVNVVIDVINGVIWGLNKMVDVANLVNPFDDIPHIPEIPRLARGGVVPATAGGTLSLIGEAGRPERVEPLDPNGLSARDRAMIDRLTGSGGGTQVAVYIGTRELTELVDYVVEDRQDKLADTLTTGTKG